MSDQCCLALQALSNKTRLQILELLRSKEMCVSEICARFNMTQPSVSHHLDILKRAGLVNNEKRGREVYYRYNADAIIECCGIQFKALNLVIKKK
jgi:ArsR family transcriptional regulator